MQWGVAVTEHQRHQVALAELSDRGFEYFQPWREAVRILRGRKVRTRIPYFGRYVFVSLCASWRKILELRGVAGILLDGETLSPLRVTSSEMDWVRGMCDRNGVVELAPPGGLKFGDPVYVDEGPFAYYRGTYYGAAGKKREQATFTIFGREQKVTFKAGELKLIGK